jgi:hypothetical protein
VFTSFRPTVDDSLAMLDSIGFFVFSATVTWPLPDVIISLPGRYLMLLFRYLPVT